MAAFHVGDRGWRRRFRYRAGERRLTADLAAGTASAGNSIFSLAGIEVVLAAAFAGHSSIFYGTEQNDTLLVMIYPDASAGSLSTGAATKMS